MHPDFDEYLEQLEELIGFEGDVYKLTGDEDEDEDDDDDAEDDDPGFDDEAYTGGELEDDEEEELPLWLVMYDEVPDEGSITAFTYGLSLVGAANGGGSVGRELVLSVESTDIDWGLALGVLAKSLRGRCPFERGNVIKFGEQVVKDSGLSAFVVYTPTVLDEDQRQVRIEGRTIEFMQLIPIYEEEIALLERIGVDAFFADEEFDVYKTDRPPRTA